MSSPVPPPRRLPTLTEVVRRAEPQASAQGISLECHIAPMLPAVVADERRLRVVFDNLLSNALKYTPMGGTITVRASGSTPRLRGDGRGIIALSVTDTGPGVPVAFRDRIFDKFFRLEHHQIEDGRHPRGAGIGLYMCRQIVGLHGGRITCAAGAQQRGTSMTVELPIHAASGAVATEPVIAQDRV